MGHYDEYYEERADEERRRTLEKQARCPHSWSIAEVDMNGNVMFTVCKFCRKFHKVNTEGGK